MSETSPNWLTQPLKRSCRKLLGGVHQDRARGLQANTFGGGSKGIPAARNTWNTAPRHVQAQRHLARTWCFRHGTGQGDYSTLSVALDKILIKADPETRPFAQVQLPPFEASTLGIEIGPERIAIRVVE